ncbi:hypothetical protein KI387_023785, partial [Taxus chinensis]
QNIFIKVEDDLIMVGKIKISNPNVEGSTSTSTVDSLLQKLANNMLQIKKQLAQDYDFVEPA